ncbi:hypothetical protein BCV69DRAFT_283152 [Microstroma glucosiphilum]|uniref:Uncharacterized protein n=1 Tax=Pseudomicrostroma glucosiphilum TaxID=1684307 RepID=A0A316U4W9_9BASI|nr:hypothetical protein BCV69DRAFT_283152 [Pseudomicrostroma glucosiphilum]PWN20276.1 hypothetical protein BCV69DRAFT_283152 [Pseudomicrostroma glucosiphilum]
MKVESQEPDSAHGEEQAIHPIETEVRLFLQRRRQEIAERPLGYMKSGSRNTQSPPGKMRLEVTRTSSFSCRVQYVWQPSIAQSDPRPDAHGEKFRWIFDQDQEAERVAAAARLKAAPSDSAQSGSERQ